MVEEHGVEASWATFGQVLGDEGRFERNLRRLLAAGRRPRGPVRRVMPPRTVGFVGLGNMGSALAANLVAAGHELVTHDVAGPGRSPGGATFVDDLGEPARRAPIVVLSLPDGRASAAVAGALAPAPIGW